MTNVSKRPVKLTPGQREVLMALGEYGYLTFSHIVTLGISKSEDSIRLNLTNPLLKRAVPLINYLSAHNVTISDGEKHTAKLEFLFNLTPTGANIASELLDVAVDTLSFPKNPKGVSQAFNDRMHREAFVDIHISFNRWVNAQGHYVSLFDAYHHKRGASRGREPLHGAPLHGASTIFDEDGEYVHEIDGVIGLLTNRGTREFFALELHRGRHTKKIVDQLIKHAHMISKGLVKNQYGMNINNRVLSVHESEVTLHQSCKLLSEMLGNSPVLNLFSFNTLANVKTDFSHGWLDAAGRTSSIISSEKL